MTNNKYLLMIFFSFILFSLHAVNNLDFMSIKVSGDKFQKKIFTNGSIIFTNRTYVIENIPTAFEGFEFLASGGKEVDEGIIIPSQDGLIYIIAPSGGLSGWIVVENSEFNYSDTNKTKLSIYQKEVSANEIISIPLIESFPGATPLAKTIRYNEQKIFVQGDLIDVMTLTPETNVFPQNNTFKFPLTPPAYLIGKKYAVSLVEYPGVSKAKIDENGVIYIATHYNTLDVPGWIYTGDFFPISSARNYYVYRYEYKAQEDWIDIPQRKPFGTIAPTLIFSDSINWVDHKTVPGKVITKSLDPKRIFITNPSLVILPDGDYLASCTGAFRVAGESAGMSFFLSTDKGQTWTPQAKNSVTMSFSTLFVHRDELYIIGTKGSYRDVIIRKSIDKGKTWTEPTNNTNGILLQGGFYHSAPVPLVINNGRIWRGMENAINTAGNGKKAFVMSAPVDADLMRAESWVSTNQIPYQTDWISNDGRLFKQWLEGNVVVDRFNNIVNILRVDEEKYGGVAAITSVDATDKLSFNPDTDIINFPGGGKKFTIRYDSVSDKYWTLSNAEFDEDRAKTHNGIYKNGIHCGLLRNRLVLMYSDNLRDWAVKDTLLSSGNPFFHGFQYVDWQFEEDDIIAVSRTAFENENGLPVRQHDANYLTFHRFENFRKNLVSSVDQFTDNSGLKIYDTPQTIKLSFDTPVKFDAYVYDMTGRMIYRANNSFNYSINKSGWSRGTYIIKVQQRDKVKVQKIIIA